MRAVKGSLGHSFQRHNKLESASLTRVFEDLPNCLVKEVKIGGAAQGGKSDENVTCTVKQSSSVYAQP
jgi:hypothetical protein